MTTPCITKLHQAGVKFKLGSSRNLFDIRFNNGILEIPKLNIHDYTELTLRQLSLLMVEFPILDTLLVSFINNICTRNSGDISIGKYLEEATEARSRSGYGAWSTSKTQVGLRDFGAISRCDGQSGKAMGLL
ncbi:unnamed protein product [Prunus armeniaca]